MIYALRFARELVSGVLFFLIFAFILVISLCEYCAIKLGALQKFFAEEIGRRSA